MSHIRFLNKDCEFYPCHSKEWNDWDNCLFCYCPLYLIECEGFYSLLSNGLKDCSKCILPHISENYSYVIKELKKQLFTGV